ncbi:DUF6587 family protein [Lysobacter koreensis]|uniref:DUF6587 family protein n=1 Tax=Lysobacter koreensis TaxID=266122 RepID=A0ABW2YJR4_9GAMM
MDAGLLVQYAVIALAVVLSAGYVARRQFPGPVRRLRIACAVPMVRDGRPSWLRSVGLWIAPPALDGDGACGSGCNGCGPTRSGH